MKVSAYTKPLIITVICLFTIGLIQGQEKTIRHKPLNFTVSYEPIKSKTKGELYNIVIRADGKAIKKAERVYVRISDPKTEESHFLKALNKDVLKGEKANKDKSFKKIKEEKNKIKLNFGPFKEGEYNIYIKIKDGKKDAYFKQRTIII